MILSSRGKQGRQSRNQQPLIVFVLRGPPAKPNKLYRNHEETKLHSSIGKSFYVWVKFKSRQFTSTSQTAEEFLSQLKGFFISSVVLWRYHRLWRAICRSTNCVVRQAEPSCSWCRSAAETITGSECLSGLRPEFGFSAGTGAGVNIKDCAGANQTF